MNSIALFLLLAGMGQQGNPPNIPCHIGDSFILSGQTWDCATEGTVIPPTMPRWRKHSPETTGTIVGDFAPISIACGPPGSGTVTNEPVEDVPAIQVKQLGPWIEKHCHLVGGIDFKAKPPATVWDKLQIKCDRVSLSGVKP